MSCKSLNLTGNDLFFLGKASVSRGQCILVHVAGIQVMSLPTIARIQQSASLNTPCQLPKAIHIASTALSRKSTKPGTSNAHCSRKSEPSGRFCNEKFRPMSKEYLLCTYQEWQSQGQKKTGRLLMVPSRDAHQFYL